MVKQDELSSTERLLELIRDEKPAESPDNGIPKLQPNGQRFKAYLGRSLALRKKSISVGVDLGHEDLKIVSIHRISDRRNEILGCARIAFEPAIHRDHPDFPQFLRSALGKVLGSYATVELWATIPSARVETRYLKIPKLAPKQIATTVFWTYQKQSPFSDKDTIFDFEILGDTEEGGVEKTAVLAYIAPRSEVDNLKDLFTKAGYPLMGVSIVPFAFQTLLRFGRIPADGSAISSLYIGRDWSRIDIFAEGNLVLSRGIKAGIRTMAEALQREIEQNWFELSMAKSPTSDQNRIRAIKTRLRQELESAQKLFFSPIHEQAPARADDKRLAVKEDRIFQMILPALERLVRQMERTIRHFGLNFDNARVEKIFVSSGVRPHPRILDYIGDELGLPIETINPFGSNGDLHPSEMPESVQEQSAFAPAMGMALATNQITPNFLHTYKERNKDASARRINRAVFACFFGLIVALVGFALWQERQIQEKEYQKLSLQNRLAEFDVRVDKALILKLVDQIRARNQSIQGIGNNFLGVAVLGEVANMTPANVRLLHINSRFENPTKPAPGGKPGGGPKKIIIVEGIITGDRSNLESDLAAYLMALKNSPLFREAAISKKSVEMMNNQPVMRFTAQMDVV